jgi:hypothetical protein
MRCYTAIICLPLLVACGSAPEEANATAGATSNAAARRLDVLGIRIGDSPEQVVKALATQGMPISNNSCDSSNSFDKLVNKMVADGSSDPLNYGSTIQCGVTSKDGNGRDVDVSLYLTPAGYRTGRMTYSFPFTGEKEALTKTLSDKYGKPSRMKSGYPAFASAAPGDAGVELQASIGGNKNGYIEFGKLPYGASIEADKVIVDAVNKRRGSDKVKL